MSGYGVDNKLVSPDNVIWRRPIRMLVIVGNGALKLKNEINKDTDGQMDGWTDGHFHSPHGFHVRCGSATKYSLRTDGFR